MKLIFSYKKRISPTSESGALHTKLTLPNLIGLPSSTTVEAENSSISGRKARGRDDKPIGNDFPIWTRISETIYTYSAFLDLRSIGNQKIENDIPIRIIGLWKLPSKRKILQGQPLLWHYIKNEIIINPEEYTCKVFYVFEDTQELIQVNGLRLTHQIFEEGLKIYAGTFFNCYINKTFAKLLQKSTNEINIGIYPTSIENYPDKLSPVSIIPDLKLKNLSKNSSFGACIRPLFGPMNDLVQLNQFLSFYTTMGVTEFNFYDFGLSPRVRKYLNEEITPGIFIRKWNLPTGNWNELWDYGSLAALNDCLYRNMDKTWLIIVDIDEFMVLQNGNENTTLISLLQKSNYNNYSQLLVRNTFFCKEFCNNFSTKSNQFPIFSCITRTKRIWNVNIRTKFILQPLHILQIGHHTVTKFLDISFPRENQLLPVRQVRFKTYVFPEQILILNHYRECTSISTRKHPILDRSIKVDKSILKFMTKVKPLSSSKV